MVILIQGTHGIQVIEVIKMTDDILITMKNDLERALLKPQAERHWIMVIDRKKCVGCHACTAGCISENKLPPKVYYRPVLEKEEGIYPNVKLSFTPRPCMQCDNPPCVVVCPMNATSKGPDGIVLIDYELCVGCKRCISVCPYSARTFDSGIYYTSTTPPPVQPYETLSNFEYEVKRGRSDTVPPTAPIGRARKCHFCIHRLNAGILPACVTTCIGRATYFGDRNDNTSMVSNLVNGIRTKTRLLEERGTDPQVYYLEAI